MTKENTNKAKRGDQNMDNNTIMTNENLPERVRQNIAECWDEEEREFDWDEYQHLCDIAEYWGMEE